MLPFLKNDNTLLHKLIKERNYGTYGKIVALPTGTVFCTTFAPFSIAKAA
jgi:hypothetical protein